MSWFNVWLQKKHTVGFKCPTGAACRHVWRCAMEQMLFFTLPTSSDAPSTVSGGGFFSWGSKFKYVGRTEREILEDSSAPAREEPAIQRTSSLRRKASSVPATPSTPLQPHLGYGYASLPRSSQSDAGSSRADAAALDAATSQDPAATLETVSEDVGEPPRLLARHHAPPPQPLKESSIDHLSDYYFRDSFDHSSSESQLHENSFKGFEVSSHRSSRSPTPLGHGAVAVADGRLCLQQDNLKQDRKSPQTHHKFNLLRAFVPSLAFVVIFVAILTVIMLETDCELFGSLRNLPEIISLRYQYYEPFKQYLRNKFSCIF